MKTKVSDAIHILLLLASNSQERSSAWIAANIQTHPAYVRQIMSKLRQAGLIEASQGKASTKLAKNVHAITMYDVYRAIEGDSPLFAVDTDTNPESPMGTCVQTALQASFTQVEQAALDAMRKQSLADIQRQFVCGPDCNCNPEICPCAANEHGGCTQAHCTTAYTGQQNAE